jgi:hypothetical protein
VTEAGVEHKMVVNSAQRAMDPPAVIRKQQQGSASQASADNLPLQHVISTEIYMPREFATAMMVHVSMQPKLMYILQVSSAVARRIL